MIFFLVSEFFCQPARFEWFDGKGPRCEKSFAEGGGGREWRGDRKRPRHHHPGLEHDYQNYPEPIPRTTPASQRWGSLPSHTRRHPQLSRSFVFIVFDAILVSHCIVLFKITTKCLLSSVFSSSCFLLLRLMYRWQSGCRPYKVWVDAWHKLRIESQKAYICRYSVIDEEQAVKDRRTYRPT